MNTFTVSFFGHRMLENPLKIEEKLEEMVSALLREKPYVEFLVGRNGEFDQLAASVVRRCRRKVRDDNSALVLVLPYESSELRNEEAFQGYYDETEICIVAAGVHFKKAYQLRNQTMVDRSDLVIACIQHSGGGAWQTVNYAQKQGIPIANLARLME